MDDDDVDVREEGGQNERKRAKEKIKARKKYYFTYLFVKLYDRFEQQKVFPVAWSPAPGSLYYTFVIRIGFGISHTHTFIENHGMRI